ncbi:hypothetical protein ACF0H5_002820 [Mactra antiquata]
MNRLGRFHTDLDVDEDTKQRPIKHSCCVSLRRDVHWKSLILTLLILGCLGAIAWCRLAVITTVVMYYDRYSAHTGVSRSSPCADGYIYIPIAFVVLLYLVYLVECWHCHTRIELQNKVDMQTVYHKMRQMREALPIIWWKALCYHYVRRTRQVTRYRNGDAFTSTQVYYERVNSHTAGCAFNFTNCGFKDNTTFVTGLEDYPATKIKFSKSFSFAHPDAKYEFDEQRNQFFVENERRDDYMETREGMDLLNVNFKEYMLAFKDPDNLPWYVSNAIFWTASSLLLSWPLRVIIEYKTAYIHYHVHKIFGTNYVNTEQSSGGRMTRANTIGSAELEMIVRNNFTLVPSYSEALLINADTTSTRTLHESDVNSIRDSRGPTRSVTWNNISNSNIGASSGYITGLFSSLTIPDMIHSPTFQGQDIRVISPVSNRSLRNSLRNLLRSPWSRRRTDHSQSCNTRMFMLSSPQSLDGFTISFDHQLQSAELSRNYSMCDFIGDNDSMNNNSSKNTRTDTDHGNSNQTHPNTTSQCLTTCNTAQPHANVQNDECSLHSIVPQTSQTKPKRPKCIVPKGVTNDNNSRKNTNKPVFIKSNLPPVPVNSIVHNIPTDALTPSSPPTYEQAVHMQRHLPHASADRVIVTSERETLLSDDRQRSRYNAIMETSL